MATLRPYPNLPCSLGLIAPTSGTPLAITNNYTDLATEFVNHFTIQALTTNTGLLYVLQNSSSADTSTYKNVIAILTAGQVYVPVPTPGSTNPWQISTFFIDVASTGDSGFAVIIK